MGFQCPETASLEPVPDRAYAGNRAIHLPVTLVQVDQPPLSVQNYRDLLGDLVTPPPAMAAGIQSPYPDFVKQFGASATVEQALEPFPQFASFGNNYENDGTAFYDALQVQAEKRFSNGLNYMADLTLGGNMSNTQTGSAIFSPNGENSLNEKAEYSPSSNDQEYITNSVTTYELPIGPGKPFLNALGPLSLLFGGWQVSGLLTYAGGTPMGATNDYNPLLVDGFDRPNVVPGVAMTTYNYNRSEAVLYRQNRCPAHSIYDQSFRKYRCISARRCGPLLCGLANSTIEN